MYEFTGPLLGSELSYRAARLKNGVAVPRRRAHTPFTRVRRRDVSAESAR